MLRLEAQGRVHLRLVALDQDQAIFVEDRIPPIPMQQGSRLLAPGQSSDLLRLNNYLLATYNTGVWWHQQKHRHRVQIAM